MAIQIVVRESEIDTRLCAALVKLRDGLLLARGQGINAEYPKTLDVRMTVLAEFEVLATTDGETSVTRELLGGNSITEQETVSRDQSQQDETGTKTSEATDEHAQTQNSTQTNQAI